MNKIKNVMRNQGVSSKEEQNKRMNLPGSPNMTYEIVEDFFQEYVGYIHK